MILYKFKGLEFDMVFYLDLYEWVLLIKKFGFGNDFRNLVYDDFI